MARTPKVTEAEIKALQDVAEARIMDLHDISRRAADKGLAFDPTLEQVSDLIGFANALHEVARIMLFQIRQNENNARFERELRERVQSQAVG